MSHKISRRGRMKRGHGRKSFNARPLITIILVALAVLAVLGLAVFVVFPTLSETLGLAAPAPTPVPPEPTPSPSPSPAPLRNIDFASVTRELQLEQAFVGYPVFMDGKLLFAGNSDNSDGSKFDKLYLYDPDEGDYAAFPSPELQNYTLANLACNEKWIAYLDHKDSGGGFIMAMKKEDKQPFKIKTYYTGIPRLCLLGDTLLWTERTGTNMDKLFALDLNTLENVTLFTFSSSPYGVSACSAYGDEIVWANYDPDQSDSEAKANPKSSIVTLKVGAAHTDSYKPGVYVHDPVANSEAVAWMDGNHSPSQKLYIRIGTDEPEAIAEGVTAYAFGKSFLAYCQNERLYAYSLREKQPFPVTEDGTKSILIGVSENRILWYDITDGAAQGTCDFIKFAQMPE